MAADSDLEQNPAIQSMRDVSCRSNTIEACGMFTAEMFPWVNEGVGADAKFAWNFNGVSCIEGAPHPR